MQKTVLKNYAKLLARVGLNVQKGQEVIITAELDQPEFVELAAEECYRAGAAKVRVEWAHQPVSRLAAEYCDEAVLGEVRPWQEEKLRCQVRELPARLYLESADPDGMSGIDAAKYSRAMQARSRIVKPYRDKMENKYQWCIAAVAGEKWAKKVFPRATSASIAVEKLWRAILSCSRALEGNPIENWSLHDEDLAARCAYLNSLGLTSLEYQSSNGTDLRVGLLREGLFSAGEEKTLSGIPFNANIPSEEVFTSPKKGEAEGVVYSTKPLSYQGQLIRNFSVRFEGGRAVEVHGGRGAAQKDDRDGRGRVLPRRVRARALRFSRQRQPRPLLQHAVRRKRRLPPRLRQGIYQLRARLRGQDGRAAARDGRQRLHHPRRLHDRQRRPAHRRRHRYGCPPSDIPQRPLGLLIFFRVEFITERGAPCGGRPLRRFVRVFQPAYRRAPLK